MNIKTKLILIGICVVIIITVFTVNVVRRLQEDKQDKTQGEVVVEDVISRAEAYRLISYLEYNKSKRETLPIGFTYTDQKMSDWYDSYVNAVFKMGLIGDKVSISPKEPLTYAACKELIDQLIIKYPEFQSVYGELSYDFSKADKEMRIPDFLELYEAILAIIPDEEQLVKKETMLVLGNDITEDGRNRLVTDLGKYYYLHAKDYEKYYEELNKKKDNLSADGDKADGDNGDAGNASDNKVSDNKVSDKAQGNTDVEDKSKVAKSNSEDKTSFVNLYLDKGIHVLVCEQEIIVISGVTTEKHVIRNAWIKKGDGQKVEAFIQGIDKSLNTITAFKSPIEKVVGDITVENQKVIQISVKPDKIQGKVLRTGEDYIEIEGYGEVPLDEQYRIYKIYEEISIEPTGSILVGYENTDFIVSGGKISAALITESIKAENIRVLIKTNDFKDMVHDRIEITSSEDFSISSMDSVTSFSAGEVVVIEPESELLKDGRIKLKAATEDGRIEIRSITRSYGNPKYRGSIEIALTENEDGLLIINELPLEEYLYAVIPSEMPTSYGNEALKVQAVCARSYAYKHLLANSLSRYGAHVDDSVSYQVYNNLAENEDSILAVKDTYGKVIEYEGDIIVAYYFSTSSGHTTEPSSVWANDVDLPYLTGKLMLVEDEEGEGDEAQSEAYELYEDLSTEESFRSFIEEEDLTTYDSGFNWYRWRVTMSVENVQKVIDNNLASRYNSNPALILTMTKEAKDGEDAVFESIPVSTVGKVLDISVLKRGSSGIISELLIKGSENTIKVRTEYNIRALLAPTYDTLIRKDESKVDNLALLPSAFFTIDKEKKNKKLKSLTLIGGGYGHGVGMSQNGVKALADSGKAYDEILKYFYEGTDIGFIYE